MQEHQRFALATFQVDVVQSIRKIDFLSNKVCTPTIQINCPLREALGCNIDEACRCDDQAAQQCNHYD